MVPPLDHPEGDGMPTFSQLAAEYLQGFGFKVSAETIPPIGDIQHDWQGLLGWWKSLDERTKRILESSNLAEGLKQEGFFTSWPGLYDLFQQNPSGGWGYCFDNIETAVNRAFHAEQEQAPYQPDTI